MELTPDYKQTEVGPIPADWDVIPLGKCLLRPPRYGINAAAVQFDDALPTYIRITDISGEGRFAPAPKVSVAHRQAADYLLNDGDLVFARTGASVGKSYCYDPNDGSLVFAGFLIQITPDAKRLRPGFLKQYVQTGAYWDWVATMSARSGQPGINGQEYGTLLLPLPPTSDEQDEIATALSDVDALLDGLNRLIAKKRGLKQAAMQQLLTGEIRLPGFEGEWWSKCIEQLAVVDPESLAGATAPDFAFSYIALDDVDEGKLLGVSEEVFKTAPSRARRILRHNDVLLSTVRPNLRSHLHYTSQVPNAVCSTGFAVLRARPDEVHAGYLYAHLFGNTVNRQIDRILAGSNYPAINSQDVRKLEVPIPPMVQEQAAIAAVLSDMDSEIAVLERRRAKYADLKQAMMQELLTGRTRLVEPQESEAEEASASQSAKGHNWAINEAVVIAALVNHFGSETYPLGRKRYTKLAYLLHRHTERKAEGYLKKAAGPYNPQAKYGGPEKIAKKNGYIKQQKGPKGHSGFIAADNIDQAEEYFEKWYGRDTLDWLNQFRFSKNDALEVLTTVDMAVEELQASRQSVDVEAVKNVIRSHPEWESKLDRPVFSDENIAEAIEQGEALFGAAVSGGTHV